MYLKLIDSIRVKISWLESTADVYLVKAQSTKNKMDSLLAQGYDEDSIEFLSNKFYLTFYSNTSQLLKSRRFEAKCIIESMENPTDMYLKTHANLISSKSKVEEMHDEWRNYKVSVVIKFPWVSNILTILENELHEIISAESYQLEYNW